MLLILAIALVAFPLVGLALAVGDTVRAIRRGALPPASLTYRAYSA